MNNKEKRPTYKKLKREKEHKEKADKHASKKNSQINTKFIYSYLKEMKKQYGSYFNKCSKESYKSSVKTDKNKLVILKKETEEGFKSLM